MTFQHQFLPREELTHMMVDGERRYKTPIGLLPSVTTVIGRSLDKSYLERWKEKIGEEEAEAIRCQASVRGHAIHDLCERYVLNDPNWRNGEMPINLETFQGFRPILDKNIEKVYGLELPLWSKVLKTAGQADMVAVWDGKKAIIDYKTSLRPKTEEDCLGYMLQGTTYALMMYERYRITIPLVVVMIAVDHQKYPTVYAVPTSKYWEQVKDIFIDRRQNEVISPSQVR